MPDNERYLDLTGLTQYDTKIKEVIQKDITAAWQASYSYVVGKYVVYKGVLYQCKTAHTSTTTFDTTKWNQVNLIDQAIPAIAGNLDIQLVQKNIASEYDSSKTYPTNGEYVSHNGQLYKIKSGQTATGTWDYSKWDSVQVMPQVKKDITSSINSSVTSNMADAWDSSTPYEAGDYVTYNGQLYKALQGQNSGNPPDASPLFWSAVQVMDEVAGAFPAQDAHKVFAGPISGSAATPTFRILDATDIPDLSGTYVLKSTFDAKGDLLVGTGDNAYSKQGVGSNGQVLTANSSESTGVKWVTLSKSDIGLGNVENTGDSDTPVSAGTDKFTTGGAYTLKTQLQEEIRNQASHYRGSFPTWAAVPTTDSTSATPYHYTPATDDPSGKATPTNNDYMIVENASDYGTTYTGTWRFIFAGEWNESAGAASKAKWTPAYKIDSDKSFKTINTTNTTAQTAIAAEELVGTGSINLHKVSKTGSYNDLLNKPTIPTSFNITANATDGIFDITGTGGANSVTYSLAPYASSTATESWVGNSSNAGKFYLGDEDPVWTTRLNYNGNLAVSLLRSRNGITIPQMEAMGDASVSLHQGGLIFFINNGLDTMTYKSDGIEKVKTVGSTTNQYNYSLPDDSGTIALEENLPEVEFTETAYTTGATTIAGMKVGDDKYNFIDTDTGATSVEVTGSGNAVTTASYDASTRKITLTKGTTFPTTDNDHYHTTFTWSNGTTSGPTGSLTGNTGTPAVTFSAIPSASNTQSGVVTTNAQTFAGVKSFNNGIKLIEASGSTSYYATLQGNSSVTSNITITLPSTTGTLALTSQIPSVTLTQAPGQGTGDSATTVTTWGLNGTEYSFESISKTEINALF